MIHSYSGILFSNKEEGNIDLCSDYLRDYAEWEKPISKDYILYF
jgi:hypothetical protein